MKDPLESSRRAAKGAFNQWHGALGIATDSDLDLYKSLEETDIDRIVKKYGVEQTTEYIQEMEKRISKQGGMND